MIGITRFSCSTFRNINKVCNPNIFRHSVFLSQVRFCANEEEKFTPIYKLSGIKYAAPLCSLSKYIYASLPCAIAISGVLEYCQIITDQNLTANAGYYGVMFSIFTTGLSLFFRKTIGIIYVSENLEKLKISSLSYWGRRVDNIVPTNDWVPLSELPISRVSFFYFCKVNTIPGKFKLFYRQGEILDKEKALYAIGEV